VNLEEARQLARDFLDDPEQHWQDAGARVMSRRVLELADEVERLEIEVQRWVKIAKGE
jgi:hypothetical protein